LEEVPLPEATGGASSVCSSSSSSSGRGGGGGGGCCLLLASFGKGLIRLVVAEGGCSEAEGGGLDRGDAGRGSVVDVGEEEGEESAGGERAEERDLGAGGR